MQYIPRRITRLGTYATQTLGRMSGAERADQHSRISKIARTHFENPHTTPATMSFSSETSSESVCSAGSVSTTPSSPPYDVSASKPHDPQDLGEPQPLQPNYKTLENLLLSSVDLARSSFTRHSTFGINTPTTHYLRLHARVNKFMRKYRTYDFVRDGTYGYVLEILILMRLVETALGMSHRDIIGLECEHAEKQEERQRLEKKCNKDIDYLVFGGRDLDVERLPWNLKSDERSLVE